MQRLGPMDINFEAIAPASGGQYAAFEELCCQLARRSIQPLQFVRLRGDGGDGGIEGYVELSDGKRVWQAKYVFDPSRLVRQASTSFRTALKNHPDLRSFVLCFPFDPTGKTRRGQGGVQKLDDWRTSELQNAEKNGRDIQIELWSASELRARIIEHDVSGGLRSFFFGKQILTNQWFKDHLDQAWETAGPRYTPELNVPTDMRTWFAALGRTSAWSNALSTRLRSLQEELRHLRPHDLDASNRTGKVAGNSLGHWPADSARRAVAQIKTLNEVVATLQRPAELRKQEYSELMASLRSSAEDLRSIEEELALDVDRRHGGGAANSPNFRQHMAEWMATLPAANLDLTRNVVRALDALVAWLKSPAFALAFETSFVLTGEAGSGKTHGICDVASRRREEGLRTCLLFGHQFMNEPDPWTRMAETLGLTGLGRDRLLDAMDSAGEASGAPLLVCIDAINETKPLNYWKNRLMPILHALSTRRFLRVCIVCRTPYAPTCLPEQNRLFQVAHLGFSGHQREACRAYCEHYGLHPPTMPVLQPEMDNPLYLQVVCKTAQYLGLPSLPPDWAGSVKAIEAFLDQMERRFAEEQDVPVHAKLMHTTLMTVVSYLVDHAVTSVPWSTAAGAVLESIAADRKQAYQYLEWLVHEGLLIDDPPSELHAHAEGTLRLAFERLSDFLVADAVLRNNVGRPPDLAPWIGTVEDIRRHSGMLGVLSALLPERNDAELPNMTGDPEGSNTLLELTITSLQSRSELAFTDRTEALVRRALTQPDLSFHAMEALVSIAWRPYPLDVHWLDDFLRSMPLAERDAYWCTFLHESFSEKLAVSELIDAARETSLEELDVDIAERWAMLLFWFTAAADRRVKDGATRAAIAVLSGEPNILPPLMTSMLSIDDDAVRERVLLVAYGVLFKTRHLEALKDVASTLRRHYARDPAAFANALIRDHIRAICELAAHLGVLPVGIDPHFANEAKKTGEWPLPLPSEQDVEAWSKSIRLWPDNFLSDFFTYSMSCMERWENGMSREDMVKWILQTVARDFRFTEFDCERYDQQIRFTYGGGRGKPVWAERIGKKYTWVAMYQLASRLHDNVIPTKGRWAEPIGGPFILSGVRQLDPTLSQRPHCPKRGQFFATPRLETLVPLDDRSWIAREKDVPTISKLVQVQTARDQQWRPLITYLSSGRPEDRHDGAPYRDIWLYLFGYVARARDAALVFERLHGRNFLGRWMPEGLSVGGGGTFIGEYPWAIPFNIMSDEWHLGPQDGGLSRFLVPAWSDLFSDWEYDGSLEEAGVSVKVPARLFFEGEDLWWDGRGGYQRRDGRTVFLDPSVGLEGPPALMADVEHLAAKLRAMGRCLFWTLLGEKRMLGGSIDEALRAPMRTFSQIGWMDPEGAIQQSDLVFFDDPNEKRRLV